jgi:hypothetical protein
MSYEVGSSPPPDFINELLSVNFGCMQRLGNPVLRPFLQVGLDGSEFFSPWAFSIFDFFDSMFDFRFKCPRPCSFAVDIRLEELHLHGRGTEQRDQAKFIRGKR